MKKALITLTTNHFNEIWDNCCSESWNQWTRTNNYSLIRFKNELDLSNRAQNRSHAWQKLLAMSSPEANDFDYCFWVDADIFINPTAPDPVHTIDTQKISVTLESGSPYSQEPTPIKNSWLEAYQSSHNNIPWDTRGYFENYGFKSKSRPLFNTGIIGFSPKQHSQFFKDTYSLWEEGGPGTLWEMIPLNLAIQAKPYQILDSRYNRLAFPWSCAWSSPKTKRLINTFLDIEESASNEENFIRQIFNQSYFLHLAGAGSGRLEKYSRIINELLQ